MQKNTLLIVSAIYSECQKRKRSLEHTTVIKKYDECLN